MNLELRFYIHFCGNDVSCSPSPLFNSGLNLWLCVAFESILLVVTLNVLGCHVVYNSPSPALGMFNLYP